MGHLFGFRYDEFKIVRMGSSDSLLRLPTKVNKTFKKIFLMNFMHQLLNKLLVTN